MFASMYVEGTELVKRVFRSTTIWYMQSFLLRCPYKFFLSTHLIVVIIFKCVCVCVPHEQEHRLLHRTTTLRAKFYILSLSSVQFHEQTHSVHINTYRKYNGTNIQAQFQGHWHFGLVCYHHQLKFGKSNLCRPKPDCVCHLPLSISLSVAYTCRPNLSPESRIFLNQNTDTNPISHMSAYVKIKWMQPWNELC